MLTLFFVLTAMVANFVERREANRHAREATLRNAAVNPARAFDWSSLVVTAIAALSEDTTPTITPHALAG